MENSRLKISSWLRTLVRNWEPNSNVYYSNFQSGSSGCFKSQSGRRLRTSGSVSKLYSGGGDVVAHSNVHASQGSSPAIFPLRADHNRLITRQMAPAA